MLVTGLVKAGRAVNDPNYPAAAEEDAVVMVIGGFLFTIMSCFLLFVYGAGP